MQSLLAAMWLAARLINQLLWVEDGLGPSGGGYIILCYFTEQFLNLFFSQHIFPKT